MTSKFVHSVPEFVLKSTLNHIPKLEGQGENAENKAAQKKAFSSKEIPLGYLMPKGGRM